MLQSYAPSGSDLYYILRKVPAPQKQGYLALSALVFDLNRTSEYYQDTNVAEKKLLWFAQEIENFFADQVTHPIFQALRPYRDHFNKTALLGLVEANLFSLKTHIFETRSELWQHYQHLGGLAFQLKAALFSQTDFRIPYQELGGLDEALRHLIYFCTFLNRKHLYFALEDFQRHQIDPQPILHFKQLDRLVPLFEDYLNFVKTKFSLISSTAIKPLQLEVRLKLKRAELIGQFGWQFYQHQVELSPIRKLFLTTF